MGKFFKARKKVEASLKLAPLPEVRSASLASVAPHLVPLLTPTAFEAEPYRVLGYLIVQLHTDPGLRVLAISSPGMGDGKTSTAINLAGILAQEHRVRVLLVEAELRRPCIAEYLGIQPASIGLAGAILEPTLSFENVVQQYQPCNFDILLAGRSLASPYDVLKLPRFGALLQEARQHYDYVVVDTPPLLPFSDCRVIERWIDGLLVVVAAHQTPRKLLADALESTDPTKLVGLVLNKHDHQPMKDYYAYYYNNQSLNGHRKREHPARPHRLR